MNKPAVVREGVRLGAPLALTWTCYEPGPDRVACGRCDACVIRRWAFRQAGAEDPAVYAVAEREVPA